MTELEELDLPILSNDSRQQHQNRRVVADVFIKRRKLSDAVFDAECSIFWQVFSTDCGLRREGCQTWKPNPPPQPSFASPGPCSPLSPTHHNTLLSPFTHCAACLDSSGCPAPCYGLRTDFNKVLLRKVRRDVPLTSCGCCSQQWTTRCSKLKERSVVCARLIVPLFVF